MIKGDDLLKEKKMVKKWKDLCTKSTLLSLALGQLLSLLVIFAGFITSQFLKKGIFAPFSLSWLSYVLLALVNIGLLICRGEPYKDNKLRDTFRNHADCLRYYYMTWADVNAKMFVIGAFGSTSITSIMLLNYWTIPCVVLLAWWFFKANYGFQKLAGVAICIAGLLTLILSDLHSTGIKALVGDLFLVVGATFYGVSIVFEETIVKKVDRVEIMARLGIYGSLFLVPLIAIDERDGLKFILSSSETILLAIGFSIAMLLLYSGVSLLLKISGSKMLYLSLLTSNVWAALIQMFVYHKKVNWIYFVALAIVALGLVVYSREDKMNPNNGEVASIDEEKGYLIEEVKFMRDGVTRITYFIKY